MAEDKSKMFIVVNIYTTPGVYDAHFVGTYSECRLYQMANGMRAKTEILAF